jgi:streptogramin lyase
MRWRGFSPPVSSLRVCLLLTATLAVLISSPTEAVPAAAAGGGSIAEYALPASGGFGLGVTSGPDLRVWFATANGTAGRIDPANPLDVAEYFLPGRLSTNGAQARGIATGTDGNLWVTEGPANLIAEVPTSGGPIQEFPPSPCNAIGDLNRRFCIANIAADGAGNLWITEFIKDRIGRINPLDPTHTITEFDLHSCAPFPCRPLDIATGPDGNAWFTLANGSEVARVTPSGVITYFTIDGVSPQGIAAGADGQIYFNEFSATTGQDEIGRLDINGNQTGTFPIHNGANAQTLALGADGNIWIPELGLDSLGHLSPAGVYGEVGLPCTYVRPFGISSGPDGGIWFTDRQELPDSAGNLNTTPAIGRIDPLNPPAASGCSYPASGAFVIGDGNATLGGQVNFWGSQWAANNSLSGGLAPNAFKGFEASSQPSTCGGTWTAAPGNSGDPPGTVPEFMIVVVASNVTRSGSQVSGDVLHLVVVKTDPGYAGDPGHWGNGQVVKLIC